MKAFIILAVLALALPLANALEMNSTNFRIATGVLESGGSTNSTNFGLKLATGLSGQSNSSSFILCIGFECASQHIQVNAITATSSGWNSQFNFTARVTSTDNILVNVTLWTSPNNSTWALGSQNNCTACNNALVNFSKTDYACNDVGIRYIKVNVTTGFLVHETTLQFNISKGTVYSSNIQLIEGFNSTVEVNNPRNITVRIFNHFNSTYENNVSGRAWVNDTNITEAVTCTSNSTGHCRAVFQPECNFASGTKDLIVGIYNDACFFDVNATRQFINVTHPNATCERRVTLALSFNISGPANDRGFVDGKEATGFFTSSNLSKFYTCVDDLTQPEDPLLGIIFAGSKFNYINVTSGDQFTVKLSQIGDSTFLVPITIGSCTVINASTPVSGLPSAFSEFISERSQVHLVLDYPADIVGNVSAGGAFTLIVEKNDTDSNQIVIDVA